MPLVRDCMTGHVEIGNPEMSLQEVAQRMRDGDFGILPIAQNDKIVGMITDRDITIRATAEGKSPVDCTANDIMTKQVLYCYEDQSLEEVSTNLGENQIRRLPVLNRNKRLVGILSLGDLAQSTANPYKVEEALSDISRATTPMRDVNQHH